MIKKLKINDDFQNKYECFECFKELIRKDIYDLIDDNTYDIPLYKANELTEENYIWVNIINEQRDKKDKAYYFLDKNEFYLHDILYHEKMELLMLNEGYSFLFIEENKIYRFLGLYKLIEVDTINCIAKWQKQEKNEFYLKDIYIKELIEKLDYNDIELYKDNRRIIEKFNYDRIEKYIDNREKIKEILEENRNIYKFLPDKLKNDEELAIIAVKGDWSRRYM